VNKSKWPHLTDVAGDECDFVDDENEHPADGQAFGELRCKKWDVATCYKVGSGASLYGFPPTYTWHKLKCLW
jgi:hypothetical protein